MGGRGSGRLRSYSGKAETNDSKPLDIRKITRKGLLVPGSRFSWQSLVNDRQKRHSRQRPDPQRQGMKPYALSGLRVLGSKPRCNRARMV